MTVDAAILGRLAAVGTASLSTQLVGRGLRKHWIAGARPVLDGRRIAGPAFTLRFIPGREDVSTPESFAAPGSLMEAVDAAPAGAVVVAEAHGAADSGVLGDILCLKMRLAGVAGAVTDGVVRDLKGLREVGFPLWASGVAPPPSTESLLFAGYGLPVGVGGVAVFPGEVVVADEDGAIVVPPAHLADALEAAERLADLERFIVEKVEGGRPLVGLYPPDAATREEFERWYAARPG